MSKYLEVTVEIKTETEHKGGTRIKKVRETYLVDAMSVTEAEARIVKEFEVFSQDWKIVSVRESKVIDVITPDSQKKLKPQLPKKEEGEDALSQGEEND
jgi:hypothetical protein